MRVLVTAASKHGSTAAIAEVIARRLSAARFEVTLTSPDKVEAVEPYDAIVLGSAVYAGRWIESARRFAEGASDVLAAKPVWLFSSGPVGDPPQPIEESPDGTKLAATLAARQHRVFAGKLDRSDLGLIERAVVGAVRAPDGDFRAWDEIEAWADSIAEDLAAVAAG